VHVTQIGGYMLPFIVIGTATLVFAMPGTILIKNTSKFEGLMR